MNQVLNRYNDYGSHAIAYWTIGQIFALSEETGLSRAGWQFSGTCQRKPGWNCPSSEFLAPEAAWIKRASGSSGWFHYAANLRWCKRRVSRVRTHWLIQKITTAAICMADIPRKSYLPKPVWSSFGKLSQSNGTTSEIKSLITSASYQNKIFGFWSERSIHTFSSFFVGVSGPALLGHA